MFRITKVVTVTAGADVTALIGKLSACARNSRHVLKSSLAPTLPEAAAGGDLIWHLQFAGQANARAWETGPGVEAAALLSDAALVTHTESVSYEDGRGGSKHVLDRGVYRLLLISVKQAACDAAIAQFEYETYEMGLYIPGIVRWRISRVKQVAGSRPWTHVWEQEYGDLDGLLNSYMLHPHHWAWINRWYDPECSEHMIDNHLCHSFCRFDGSFIEPKTGS